MYTIGEFSKINRITTKTLRHYDKIGLIKPAHVDDWTGYRYYSPHQLPIIRRILHLRDMGFSLEEIDGILSDRINLAGILKSREQEIKLSIEEEKRRLDLVRDYQRILEGKEMKDKIVIKTLPEVMAASMRTIIPGYDTYFDIMPRMGDYMKSVGAICAEPAYCFTIYHDGEYKESDIDVEICEAVVEARQDSDKVRFKLIPGFENAACLIHRGPYSTLRETYNEIYAWITENGWEPDGPARESYIDGIWNKSNPAEWTTEIQAPVRRRKDSSCR